MTRAEWIAEWLARSGIHVAVAVQGGSIAAVIDACERHDGVRVVYAPNETLAGYAVDGACRAAGRMAAVALVTTGPGALLLAPAFEGARLDCSPVLGICGAPRPGDDFQRQTLWRLPQLGHPWEIQPGAYELRMDEALAPAEGAVTPLGRPPGYTRHVPSCFVEWVDRVIGSAPVPHRLAEILEWASGGPEVLVFADAGLTLAYTYRTLSSRLGGRLHAPWHLAPMGAAIAMGWGASLVVPSRPVLAIVGDGSLAFSAPWDAAPPVPTLCLDNGGYGAIRRYQHAALEGREYGTDPRAAEGGAMPRVVDVRGELYR